MSKKIQERKLIRAAADGDENAFAKLHQTFLPQVQKRVRYLLSSHPSAHEDVVQNVFLAVFRNLKHFRGDSSFSTWLYRVTFNESMMFLRKNVQGKPAVWSLDSILEDYATGEQHITKTLPKALAKRDPSLSSVPDRLSVLDAVSHLAPCYRRVVTLIDLEGDMHKDAAEKLGITVGCVKGYRYRAMKTLRERLS